MTNRLKPAETYTHTHTHTHTHTGKSCQIIFSTILILGAIGHAGAEPTNTSDSFPLNELMQPDYRYLNSAIYPNTGVYDGDVTVNAMYDWDLFSPTAGNYLPANSTTITQCTSGSFCIGATNIHYDSIDQGITSCSTLGDNSYTQSATGSTTETDCYRNCSGNVTIEHATTITGNDYYGAGTDTCSATACEGGYHTDNNACGANVLTITWANSDNPNTTCTYGGSITTPATAPTIPGKTFVGWAMGYDLSTLPTNNQGGNMYARSDTSFSYCSSWDGKWHEGLICSDGNFTDLNRGEWKTYFSHGKVYGTARCSITNGETSGRIGTPSKTQGQYCWCQATAYMPNGATIRFIPTSNNMNWIYADDRQSRDSCLQYCSMSCGSSARLMKFQSQLFGVTQ